MDVPELVDAFRDQPANHALLIQRVQELMGQGIDVSSLFATLVSSASTREMTIKKAAYAFLAKYGRTHEELSLLSINTLHQDCTDPDPIVRSLALRTLCSLGQKSLLRFLLQPLNKGFQDKNAHVRKTAAMACISLFELDPVFVLESEIVYKLYIFLRDRDAPVVVNAILALETILTDEGGMVINQKIASYLIQRYKDWNPSQLQIVLGVLCRYRPQTNDEIYEIMNDVDDGLQHPSLAVQMATLRLFIWLCQDLAEIQEDVQKTIEDSPSPDLVHASLCHLTLMIEATGKFQNNTTQHLSALFCRPSDPIPIKLQKLALCSTIAQQQQQHASIATADTTIPSLSRMILDHFCLVASMKNVVLFQQSTAARGARQQPLDRQTIAAQLEVACLAIDAIGQIGSHQFSQTRDNEKKDKSNPNQANIRSNARACIDRLFQLLVLFGNMERISSNIKNPRKESDTYSWMHSEIAALDLEESQVALVLSTILMAIE
ncbi:AP-4 complex subunit beta-1, partial [Dissophora globulifera]